MAVSATAAGEPRQVGPDEPRALGARDLVRAWEWGDSRHPVDRALVLLGLAIPGRGRDELAALPLGRRDALLLDLRAKTLGPTLEVFVACGKCKGELEFPVQVADLLAGGPRGPAPASFSVEHGEERAVCRLPTSHDVIALRGSQGRAAAARRLIARCVLSAERRGDPITASALSEEAFAAVAQRITEEDPLAVIRFDVACERCGHAWAADLDVIAYFWEEVTTQVRRLCREVHQLAKAYAWSEGEILAMSAARRRWYLDMLA